MVETVLAGQMVSVKRGRRLEYFTILWNSLEGLVAIIAGMLAGSISLVGFGIDSLIEVTSGAALLWRMSVDADVPHAPTSADEGDCNLPFASPENTNANAAAWAACLAGVMA